MPRYSKECHIITVRSGDRINDLSNNPADCYIPLGPNALPTDKENYSLQLISFAIHTDLGGQFMTELANAELRAYFGASNSYDTSRGNYQVLGFMDNGTRYGTANSRRTLNLNNAGSFAKYRVHNPNGQIIRFSIVSIEDADTITLQGGANIGDWVCQLEFRPIH